MFKWLKTFFVRTPKEPVKKIWSAEDMPTEDDILNECMARALNSGEPVFASRNDDGSVTFI